MGSFLFGFFTFRFFALTFASAFSVLLVMLFTGIITAQDVANILDLSPESEQSLQEVIERGQSKFDGVAHLVSRLLEQLLGWTGAEVDLSKIEVDVNKNPEDTPPVPVE